MKVGLNYYGVQNQRTQGVSKCPSFKCTALDRTAQELANLAMDDLFASERGGWQSRHSEIIDILVVKAKQIFGETVDKSKIWGATEVLRSPSMGCTLPSRIRNAAKHLLEG